MKPVSISIENFMSFHVLKDFILEAVGLCLVQGKNGSGKSSIWDAICWVLFGKTIRGLKGDEIVHNRYNKDCYVSLKVEDGDTDYEIRRYRKHKLKKNDFEFYIDGKLAVAHSSKSMQEVMEEKLGVDYKTFCSTVLFGQGARFNFMEATDKEQKEILSKIEYTEDLEEAAAHTKELKRKKENELIKAERDMDLIEEQIEDTGDKESIEQDIKDWEINKNNSVKDHEGQIEYYSELVEKYKPAKEAREKYSKLKTKVENKIDKFDFDEDEYDDIKSNIMETKSKLLRLEDKEEESLEEMDKVKKSEGAKCKECKQVIKKAHVEDQLKSYDKEVKSIKSDIRSLMEKKEFQEDEKELQEEKKIKLKELKDKLSTVKDKLSNAKVGAEKYNNACDKVGTYKKAIASLEKQKNPYENTLEKLEVKIEELKKKKKTLIKESREIKIDIDDIEFWLEGFSNKGMKSFIFDSIADDLENYANDNVNYLTDGKVVLEFDTQSKLKSGEMREKFDARVITAAGSMPYKAYSGGEKKSISLGVDFALSEIMAKRNDFDMDLLILDEAFEHLDSEKRQVVMDFLIKKSKTKSSIFVVDHDEEFKSYFPNVKTVDKRKGESFIREVA